MRKTSLLPIVVALAALLPRQASSQYGGMDLAVAEKWGKAKVVRYRVEGVHKGREAVVHGDYEGKADVHDTLTLEFTWDVKKSAIVGPVTLTDGKTALSNVKSDGTNCGPPQLKGDYEHFQSVSNSISNRDTVEIRGTRTYPPASVSNYPASCSMRSIAGAKENAVLWVPGVQPEGLGMPIVQGGPFTVAADRKSLTVKGAGNWLWTYTPTLVQ